MTNPYPVKGISIPGPAAWQPPRPDLWPFKVGERRLAEEDQSSELDHEWPSGDSSLGGEGESPLGHSLCPRPLGLRRSGLHGRRTTA